MPTADLESVYALSPLQEGMLFHALYLPDAGLDVSQSVWMLDGRLNVDALKRAWRTTLARHAVLRTSFHWEGVHKPMQAVSREVDAPWIEDDWRRAGETERLQKLDAFLDADLKTAFHLNRAPLARLALFRTGDERHQLVLTTHHLVLDGWSKRIVLGDLLHFYDAASTGRGATLPPAPPFSEHVRWLACQDLGKAEAYWRRVLHGCQATHMAPPALAGTGDHHVSEAVAILSDTDSTLVREAARRERVTMNTLALGAYALMVSRHAGANEAVFGTAVSGRPAALPDVERRVGMFVNTLPVRVGVPPGDCVGDWLRALQRSQAEAREYEYTPLSAVHAWCRVPSRESLFDTVLAFQNYPDLLRTSTGIRMRPDRSRQRTTYPLVIFVTPSTAIHVKALYKPDRFTRAAVDTLLSDYTRLLREVAGGSDRVLATVPHAACTEQRAIERWNATDRPLPPWRGLHDVVAAWAERDPARCAVIAGDERLTYAELSRRADRLASRLRVCGVGPEVRVAVCVTHSIDVAVVPLAIWKAGGAYVPLDPEYPADRIRLMLQDCRPRLIVTRDAFRHSLPSDHGAEVLNLDHDSWTVSTEASDPPASAHDIDNLAYIIYTSGSTGAPKGVAVTHRGLVNVAAAQAGFGLTRDDRVLQSSSPSFDGCIFNVSLAFSAGASLALAPDRGRPFITELLRLLVEGQVTVAVLSPTVLSAVPREPLPHLRVVMAAGEECALELARYWARGRIFWNLYGPTEQTIWSTAQRISVDADVAPIGGPIANTRAYVLDANLQPVAIGRTGELYHSGVGTARGYHGRPDLTAERFVPNPFSASGGSRLYRTGDRVKWRADGTLHFVGRADHQVKLRGYRVELGEVETALRRHPMVEDAVAIVHGRDGDAQLVAYVVCREGAFEMDDVRSWLAGRLPHYMVPGIVTRLAEWPLTPSGKLDRSKLPDPRRRAAPLESGAGAETALERVISGIWSEILGVDAVGVDGNFFELGGNSVLAIRVCSKLRERCASGLPLVTLFQYPTIRSLARHLGDGRASEGTAVTSDDSARARGGMRRARRIGRQRGAIARDERGA
ncbi:MAG: amino acid adenylation domain-containing protein [Vicinamibacterales bacterium]